MKNRQRGRNGGKPRPPGGRNPNFDGNNGGRMRGNAQQLMEKYLSLARDASSSGDRVLAENYFQHADHYYRVLNARFEQQQQNGQRPYQGGNPQQNYNQGGYNQDRMHDGDQQPRYDYQGGQPEIPPQTQHVNPQPQPYVQQGQAQAQPQSQPAQNQDIGLPPGILGEAAPAPEGEPQQGNEGGDFNRSRNHQHGRRRRGRGERSFADAGAGE